MSSGTGRYARSRNAAHSIEGSTILNTRGYLFIIFLLIVSALAACGSSQKELDALPSQDAIDFSESLTEEAKKTIDASATEARGTEVAVQSTATDAAAIHALQTEVEDQKATVEALAEARQSATDQAQPLSNLVRDLNAEGYLSRTDGIYYALPRFDESWAQIDWYQWSYTDYSPTDFVIIAEASWDSASDKANWWNSGCGFVFREDGVSDHYLAYLGLDGSVYLSRNVRDIPASLGSSYYGRLDTPKGQAQIMLVVEGTTMTFFVNGERVHTRQDQGLESGNLALTILSGINTGFGTRCEMTDIQLWELTP